MRLSYDLLFLLPLTAQLLLLLAAAWYYRRRRPLREAPRRALIFRCNRCWKIYLDQRRIPLSRCPVCSVLNEPIKR